jgi:hypothetical protein
MLLWTLDFGLTPSSLRLRPSLPFVGVTVWLSLPSCGVVGDEAKVEDVIAWCRGAVGDRAPLLYYGPG